MTNTVPILKYNRTQLRSPLVKVDPDYYKSYSNHSNIDWSYEYEKLQIITSQNVNIWNKYSKSIILLLMGVTIGPMAIVIDVCSRYLNDIKYGVCIKDNNYKFLSKVQCGDTDWQNWSDILNLNKNSILQFLNNYMIFTLLSVLFAYLTTLLVKRQPFVKYSGISELKIILSGYILRNFLNVHILIYKSISLVLVIASGIWVGKEGPVVHIAACIAHLLIQLFPIINTNEALKREMITASTLLGIGVAFNAPIGGVLFCLEQIRTYSPIDKSMWNSFFCATVSVMILQVLHPFSHLIYGQIFKVTNDSQNWLSYEIFPFMLLGIIGGYLGILFNKLNAKFAEVRAMTINKSIRSKILEVVSLSFITAVITYPFVITRIPLTELISLLFSDCNNRTTENDILSSLCYDSNEFPWKVIFLLLVSSIQGFALAAYSYGTFIPGGVLMPSLTIGAIIGRIIGTLIEFLQFKFPTSTVFQSCSINSFNCITPGSYAVVGALSVLTSVTKMSVSVVVILFELTGALNYVIPIMIGVLLSRFVADIYSDNSCYEFWLYLQKYPYLRPGLDEELSKPILSVLTCNDFLKPTDEIKVIYDDEISLDLLNSVVQDTSIEGFPILNNPMEKKLIGWCSRYELSLILDNFNDYHGPVSFQNGGVLNKILSQTDYNILPSNLSILTIYAIFDKLSLNLLIFVKPDSNLIFKSLMTRIDLINIIEMNEFELINKQYNY